MDLDIPANLASAPLPKAVSAPEPKEIEPSERAVEEEPKLTAAEKKIWKLKADGEDFEFDASDDEATKREIMKARGANKRFEAASAMKKQAENFFEMLKNPETLEKVLTDPRVGIDFKQFAEDYVYRQIEADRVRQEEAQLSPEERNARQQARDKDRRLAEYEAKEKAAEEKAAQTVNKERQSRYEQQYEAKILTALEMQGIPKTPGAITRMANYLSSAIDHGYDLTPEDLAKEVSSDYSKDVKTLVNNMSVEQLMEFVGKDNIDKIRKADLARLKSTQSNPFSQRSQPQKSEVKSQQPKKLSTSDWKEDVMKNFPY